jgi:hypothetical protein
VKSEPLLPAKKTQQIDRHEWQFVWLVTLILLVLTSLPYLYAEFSSPPNKHFMGFILNVSDHAQYLSWYKAFQSEGLIPNRLTSEPNPAIFFNLLWWLMAQVGKLTGLSYIWMYQILRIVSGFAFFGMVYWFIARVFAEKFQRKLVLLLLAVSSGFGWVLVLLKYTLFKGTLLFPLDLYVAEGNTLLCLMAYPHFLEAGAFILGTLALLLVGEEKGRYRWAVAAGLVAFLLGWQHGYDLLIVWSIPICYAIARWFLDRRFPMYWFKAMLITGLISCPPAIYNLLLTRLDPTWSEVLAQFANAGVYTPNLLHFFILLGLPLLIALITAVGILVKAMDQHWQEFREKPVVLFLLIWFIFGWLLTYIPTDFQIHMINSWQVPVILLAGVGLFRWLVPWLQKHLPNQRVIYLASGLIISFCALTNLYLFAWRFYDLHRYDYPFFLNVDEVSALHWLEENTPADSVVLSNLEIGQYIPGISGRTAFLAHWAQTIHYYDKQEIVANIFDKNLADAEKLRLLRDYGVDYVLSGSAEHATNGIESMTQSILTPVWTSGEVTIYTLKPEPTGALP